MGRCLESPHRIRASCLYLLLFTGSVPRGVFCEQSSQKTRECRREIMQGIFLCIAKRVAVNVVNSNLYSYVADSNE